MISRLPRTDKRPAGGGGAAKSGVRTGKLRCCGCYLPSPKVIFVAMNLYPPPPKTDHAVPLEGDTLAAPFEVIRPVEQTLPFVFASPHSGRHYSPDFLAASRLDLLTLRKSEDSFIDEVFAGAPEKGAPLLHALFPRIYLDPNREPYELDPAMFVDALPAYANTRSLRVAGGLGTVARVVTDGTEIYRQKILFAEAQRRIDTCYLPYHRQLRQLLDETKERFGYAVLIDCHSMPSIGGPTDADTGRDRADIVLGDRFGTSCVPDLTQTVEECLCEMGYTVVRNNPYAGGYTTDHYGRPVKGVHALQIEINRALYMDEQRITRHEGLTVLKENMTRLIECLGTMASPVFRSYF